MDFSNLLVFFDSLGLAESCRNNIVILSSFSTSFFPLFESVCPFSDPAPVRRHSASDWLQQLEESLSSLSGVTVTPSSQSASPSGFTPPPSATSPPLALSAVERARQRRERERRRRRPDVLPSSDNDTTYEVAGHRLRRTPSRASRLAEERRRRESREKEDDESPHTE